MFGPTLNAVRTADKSARNDPAARSAVGGTDRADYAPASPVTAAPSEGIASGRSTPACVAA